MPMSLITCTLIVEPAVHTIVLQQQAHVETMQAVRLYSLNGVDLYLELLTHAGSPHHVKAKGSHANTIQDESIMPTDMYSWKMIYMHPQTANSGTFICHGRLHVPGEVNRAL